MKHLQYAGIAIGGTHAGQMLTHHRPEKEIRPKVAVLGVTQQTQTYYYVPYLGMQGFWLSENETKGTGPQDDLIRVLSEYYVEGHRT